MMLYVVLVRLFVSVCVYLMCSLLCDAVRLVFCASFCLCGISDRKVFVWFVCAVVCVVWFVFNCVCFRAFVWCCYFERV